MAFEVLPILPDGTRDPPRNPNCIRGPLRNPDGILSPATQPDGIRDSSPTVDRSIRGHFSPPNAICPFPLAHEHAQKRLETSPVWAQAMGSHGHRG